MTTVCGSSTGSKQLTPGFLRTNLFFPAARFADFLQGANLTYTKKINMLRKIFFAPKHKTAGLVAVCFWDWI